MTKGYVAAKFEDRDLARAVMDVLEDSGYEITHDWTDETVEGKRGRDVADTFQEAAHDDLAGVVTADFLVLLHNDKIRGALVELGAALAADLPVIVMGATPNHNCFYWHSGVMHVSNIDEAIAMLGVLFPPGSEETVEEDEEEAEPNPQLLLYAIGAAEAQKPETQKPEAPHCSCGVCNSINLRKIGVA
jgi:hypothetical protein